MNEPEENVGRRNKPDQLLLWKRIFLVTVLAVALLCATVSVLQVAHWRKATLLIVPLIAIVLSLMPLIGLLAQQASAHKKTIAILLGLGCSLLIAEAFATVYFAGDRHRFESTRALLAGRKLPFGDEPNYMGQPFLLYVPKPGSEGENFHNEQGYRGKAVSMERTEGIARVLCMGGSTTYGNRVDNPNDAYPAQLEQLLNEDLPAGVRGVEVINAGISYGSTAELLTHYQFKFHYFRPDLVIINTGGNEAGLLDPDTAKYYQPDYSHWRRPFHVPQPLAPLGRTVVKSRFASWLLILLLYGGAPSNVPVLRPGGLPPPTVWHPAAKEPGLVDSLTDAQLAFTHNLNTLVDLCVKDEAKVLLVPFRANRAIAKEGDRKLYRRHERILRRIASQRGLTIAPFPASVISPDNWADFCHLKPEGCRQKAQHIAFYVRQLLWPAAVPSEATAELPRESTTVAEPSL